MFSKTTIIGLLTLVVLLYFYLKHKYSFWKTKGVLGPTPLPFIGDVLPFFHNPIVQVETERYNKYGKVYGFYDCLTPVLSVADPELIKEVTAKHWTTFMNRRPLRFEFPPYTNIVVFLKDERWKTVRSIVTQTFTSGKIRQMAPKIDECTEGVLNQLKNAAETGSDLDAKKMFGAFTMDVTARCAFSTKTNSDPNHPFIQNILKMLKPGLFQLLLYFVIPTVIVKWLSSFSILTPNRASLQYFRHVSRHLVEERKKSGQKGNDFLQLLIDAEMPKEGSTNDYQDVSRGRFRNTEDVKRNDQLIISTVPKQKKLNEEEILAQMLLFFFVGYETTSTLISQAAYSLATNPEKQEKLYQELRGSLDEWGQISYEAINELDYLDAVLCETLRIYPPLPRFERVASEDYVLGKTGIKLPKRTALIIPVYAIHHDPTNFPEPHKFRPERFLKENIENVLPYTYLPFGSGPRNCIAMRYALIEAKILLCRMVLKYKLIASENTITPVQFEPGSFFLQPKSLLLGVQKR